MGSQTDKIFRDKLKGYQRPVPPTAWNRVEQTLRGQRRTFTWMHMAAGILVLIIPAFLLWPDLTTENQAHDLSSTLSVKSTEPAEENVATIQEEIVHITPKKKMEYRRPSIGVKSVVKSPSPIETQVAQNVEADMQENDETTFTSSLPSIENFEEPIVTTPQIIDRPASNTIVYSAAEVQARFVKKKINHKTTPAKQSTGQKIAGLAIAIKNQEIGLSDLRDIKDDLLTFQFSSYQQKSIHTQGK